MFNGSFSVEKSRGKCKCVCKEEEKYCSKYFEIKMHIDEGNGEGGGAGLSILINQLPWCWLNQLGSPREGDDLT